MDELEIRRRSAWDMASRPSSGDATFCLSSTSLPADISSLHQREAEQTHLEQRAAYFGMTRDVLPVNLGVGRLV